MVSSQYEEMTELISKKEILESFGISYGQFYRWKRKGLIPEAWFIRKSTFTGQETFLPREKAMDRIKMIMDLKETHSLEEITEMLAPEAAATSFDIDDLAGNVLKRSLIDRFEEITGQTSPYSFWDVVRMMILKQLDKLDLNSAEIKLALMTLDDAGDWLDESEIDWTLWVLTKESSYALCCIAPLAKIHFDPETEIASQIDLCELIEETKLSLRRL